MTAPEPQPGPTCTGPGCHRPVDGVHLCPGCTRTLRTNLLDLAGDPDPGTEGPAYGDDGDRLPAPDRGLIDDLQLTMCRLDVAEPDTSRPAAPVDPDDVPKRTDEPIAAHPHPLHQGAANLLADAARVVRPWVSTVAWARYGRELSAQVRDGEYRATGGVGPVLPPLPFRWPAGDASSIAGWLALYPNVIAGHPDAGRLAADVSRVVRRARDIVVPRAASYLGACERCWDTPPDPPPGEPRAEHGPLVDLYAAPDDTTVVCPRCRSSWPVADRRADLLAQAADQYETAPEIERALVDFVRDAYTDTTDDGVRVLADDYRPLTASAIHGHADRGRLARWEPTRAEREQAAAERGPRPQPRYRVGDVMGLVRELRAERAARSARRELRAKSRRRTTPPVDRIQRQAVS